VLSVILVEDWFGTQWIVQHLLKISLVRSG